MFYIAGVILLLVSGWLWWTKLSLDPNRVFWEMIQQSLRTQGVTMHSVQEDGRGRLEQNIQYSLGAVNRAQSNTTIVQGEAQVSTEVIGTPDADFVRYVAVKSTRRDAAGEPLDFSKVVGVWAKSDASQGENKLLGQALLGLTLPLGGAPVPIGNLPPESAEKLFTYIKNEGIYEIDFSKARRERSNGRTYIVYDVRIQVIAYVQLMKRFAQLAGLHDLDHIDPNNYQGAAPMQVKMKVDARSKQLAEVEVTESAFKQTFSSYGIPVRAVTPEQTISATELQDRLDQLQ